MCLSLRLCETITTFHTRTNCICVHKTFTRAQNTSTTAKLHYTFTILNFRDLVFFTDSHIQMRACNFFFFRRHTKGEIQLQAVKLFVNIISQILNINDPYGLAFLQVVPFHDFNVPRRQLSFSLCHC